MEEYPGKETLIATLQEMIPFEGVYYRDILHKLIHRHPQSTIEQVLATLVRQGHARRVGSAMHPIYIKQRGKTVVYDNIRPTDGLGALLVMQSNFGGPERLLGKSHLGALARPVAEGPSNEL